MDKKRPAQAKKGLVVFINGSPGTGKSTLAIKLADRLNVDTILQTDLLKEMWKSGGDTFLASHCSHDVWKIMGKATKKNVLTGFNLLTNEYRGTIIRIIKSYQSVGKSLIVEGVQATPQIFSEIKTKNKIGIYLEILPKKQQFARFEMKNRHMKVKNKLWYENYDCIKLIDKYEKHHARMGNFFLVKNRNIDDTVSKIVNYLTQC